MVWPHNTSRLLTSEVQPAAALIYHASSGLDTPRVGMHPNRQLHSQRVADTKLAKQAYELAPFLPLHQVAERHNWTCALHQVADL